MLPGLAVTVIEPGVVPDEGDVVSQAGAGLPLVPPLTETEKLEAVEHALVTPMVWGGALSPPEDAENASVEGDACTAQVVVELVVTLPEPLSVKVTPEPPGAPCKLYENVPDAPANLPVPPVTDALPCSTSPTLSSLVGSVADNVLPSLNINENMRTTVVRFDPKLPEPFMEICADPKGDMVPEPVNDAPVNVDEPLPLNERLTAVPL
jgi:hypothetical protein